MKTLLTLSLLVIGFSAMAQRSSFSKEVTTDGQQLRIRVDAQQGEHSVHYNRSFDVSEMDARAVKALENHILDSLDQAFEGRYAGMFNERRHDAKPRKKQEESSYTVSVTTSTTESRDETAVAKATGELSASDTTPLSVIHREDKENGRLWMQYTFQRDGDELVFERTANVLGKSDREKKAIIRETERSLGLKSVNQ
ncbi:hypothetical protein [Spirosoma oryzicola]|uniref:hypothetical protein n=1 Tax=Spirosoma oryzicola TaxID=2898794 RepID=UPI001E3C678F|nr:hypothetical protein [Spirosoma oryzicola]UHG92153.1 hypothetical protein LQ777_04420 [Spirosoma oryzicola]